jgi:hypothetical protein
LAAGNEKYGWALPYRDHRVFRHRDTGASLTDPFRTSHGAVNNLRDLHTALVGVTEVEGAGVVVVTGQGASLADARQAGVLARAGVAIGTGALYRLRLTGAVLTGVGGAGGPCGALQGSARLACTLGTDIGHGAGVTILAQQAIQRVVTATCASLAGIHGAGIGVLAI